MSNYMLENDIFSVHDDESSDCEEPPKYKELHACKTKKRKKHDNSTIEDCLNQVITNWELTGQVFCITTDNSANIKKAIGLMNNITQLSCLVHMLQLSVIKGLKSADAQEKCKYPKIHQTINDVLTRWNSSYLAWIWLKELQKAIEYLVLMLLLESEHCDRLDGEYLKLINLTKNEWRLLDNLILLLKPFYEATNIFSGSSYPTHNLIYPTMRLLIKKFAPSYEQTEDDYADLLFESENEFDTLMISEQLRQLLQAAQGRKKRQVYDKTKKNTHSSQFKGRRSIELPVTNGMLCDLVKATSYFSLKEYWEATIFDIVRTLCTKEKYHQPSIRLDELVSTPVYEPVTTNDLIADLYSSEELDDEIYDETKADRYLCEPIEKKGLPATSVPSEQLFSDARLHIAALQNRFHPDIVEQMIFLKRNMQHFPIFKPDESNKSNDIQPKMIMN
ncbi:44085_t:CDS:2 [Gigaspora margarita]|uniref:44085_t:CDS:1 n=1 Tax=Gigaspora margarita TaxID=4874 RepID=A0ABN7VZ73_GIGMA|nr:44085_t:CDS:2 [Gigaspora margarita]